MLDYMVMEAVAVKVQRENEEQRKEAERSKFRKDRSDLMKHAG